MTLKFFKAKYRLCDCTVTKIIIALVPVLVLKKKAVWYYKFVELSETQYPYLESFVIEA